jgi:sugar lactone lactonase YvrE
MTSVPQYHAELLIDAKDSVGECPVWEPQEQALYWVDIAQKRLQRFDVLARKHERWQAPEMIGCLVREAAGEGLPGNWIAGMESGFFSLDLKTGVAQVDATRIAATTHPHPGMRFNDGRCDRQGRFLAGTMCLDRSLTKPWGQWWSLRNNQAQVVPAMGDAFVTNGMAFSPSGKTLYVSDSAAQIQTVWAYDYHGEHEPSAQISNKRIFVNMHQHPGRPDGAAMDADGCYWICAIDSGLVMRFTPEGTLDRQIKVPVKKPTMCAFGGPNLDLLFITSIRPELAAGAQEDLAAPRLDGGVFVCRPGVQGFPEAQFRWLG